MQVYKSFLQPIFEFRCASAHLNVSDSQNRRMEALLLGLPGSFCYATLSLVTMSTRTVWSKPEHTQRPCLSGLQSRLAIGWVDRVAFCRRLTDPATPTSAPSESFLLLCAGYSLERGFGGKSVYKTFKLLKQ